MSTHDDFRTDTGAGQALSQQPMAEPGTGLVKTGAPVSASMAASRSWARRATQRSMPAMTWCMEWSSTAPWQKGGS